MFNVYLHRPATASGRGRRADRRARPLPGAAVAAHATRRAPIQDGRIFHVISAGKNKMPATRIRSTAEDRWAVVHYVRALQRAMNPKPEDLDR